MGKYNVDISDQAKKDFKEIERSGDKASVRKIQQIIVELHEHPETGT
jgi:toxin YoeB